MNQAIDSILSCQRIATRQTGYYVKSSEDWEVDIGNQSPNFCTRKENDCTLYMSEWSVYDSPIQTVNRLWTVIMVDTWAHKRSTAFGSNFRSRMQLTVDFNLSLFHEYSCFNSLIPMSKFTNDSVLRLLHPKFGASWEFNSIAHWSEWLWLVSLLIYYLKGVVQRSSHMRYSLSSLSKTKATAMRCQGFAKACREWLLGLGNLQITFMIPWRPAFRMENGRASAD